MGASSGSTSQWGSLGSADGQFNHPAGVATSMDGTIVVADGKNSRIQCFHPDGRFVCKWGSRGVGNGQFGFPSGVAIGAKDDTKTSILEAINQVPEVAAFPPGIGHICAAYVGDECLYVADFINHRMQAFGLDGSYRRKWGSIGKDDGQFINPRDCCVDNYANLVYVVDSYNHRIQAFSGDGTFVCKWGSFGRGRDQLHYPTRVIASGSGLIYVADPYNNRIVRYRRDGTVKDEWAGRINNFGAIAVDDNSGEVYVVNHGNRFILRRRMVDGAVIQCVVIDRRLGDAVSIAMGAEGMLYISDMNNHQVIALRLNRPNI